MNVQAMTVKTIHPTCCLEHGQVDQSHLLLLWENREKQGGNIYFNSWLEDTIQHGSEGWAAGVWVGCYPVCSQQAEMNTSAHPASSSVITSLETFSRRHPYIGVDLQQQMALSSYSHQIKNRREELKDFISEVFVRRKGIEVLIEVSRIPDEPLCSEGYRSILLPHKPLNQYYLVLWISRLSKIIGKNIWVNRYNFCVCVSMCTRSNAKNLRKFVKYLHLYP